MFLSVSNSEKKSSQEGFVERKKLFEDSLKNGLESFYGIAIPHSNTGSGIFYAPHGKYQIIDHFLAFNANGIKVMQDSAEGKVWTQEDMRKAEQNGDFTEIQINLRKKNEGICIESEHWILNPGEDSEDWIYILFQVVSNVSLQQVSKFVIYYDANNANSNKRIHYIRLENDGYNLLRGALSRMASERGLI